MTNRVYERYGYKRKVEECPCGSHYPLVYWSLKHEEFRCKLCVGYYPDFCPKCKQHGEFEKHDMEQGVHIWKCPNCDYKFQTVEKMKE